MTREQAAEIVARECPGWKLTEGTADLDSVLADMLEREDGPTMVTIEPVAGAWSATPTRTILVYNGKVVHE